MLTLARGHSVTVLTLEALCDESSFAAGQSQAAQVSQLVGLGGVVNTHGLVPLACGAAINTWGHKWDEV